MTSHKITILSPEQVAEAMELRQSGASWVRLSQKFGRRPSTVKSCIERAKKYGFDAWRGGES